MTEGNTAPLARWNVGSVVWSVTVSRDGHRVAAGSTDGRVRVWDVLTGALVLRPLEGHTSLVRSVAFSPDNTRMASGSCDMTICIWETQNGAPIGKPLKGHASYIRSVAFSHDSALIVSGSDDCTIRIWDVCTGAPIGEPLKGHTGAVMSVAFSHNSTSIVSSSSDNTIRIWDAHTGTPIGKPLGGHRMPVFSVAFSTDSTLIVFGSGSAISVWNVSTGTLVGKPLEGHTNVIWSVAFSYDNNLVVSGSADRTIRTWDVRTGTHVGEPIKGHTSAVWSVAFSPDNTRIFSGSNDGTVGVWRSPLKLLSSDVGASESPSSATPTHAEFSSKPNPAEQRAVAQGDDALGSEEVLQNAPSFDMVSSSMSIEEIFGCLVKHGCTDLTSSVDAEHRSTAVIASGGFGDVRRVTLDDENFLALKTLRLDALRTGGDKGVKRAVREVYLWSKLRHTHIQELLGIVVFQNGLGMVSPWREHGNLKQYIAARPEVARHPMCVQLASAVSYLHGIGMVHGDLKSVNILVANDGTIKISDFDYAILSHTSLQFTETTRAGGGTFRWMAPELSQVEDEDGEDNRIVATRTKQTDIYALGMTMLEIVTGTVPYSEYRTDLGVCRAILAKKPPRRPKELSGTNEGVNQMWALLLLCWDYNPSARPDASSVFRSLSSFAI